MSNAWAATKLKLKKPSVRFAFNRHQKKKSNRSVNEVLSVCGEGDGSTSAQSAPLLLESRKLFALPPDPNNHRSSKTFRSSMTGGDLDGTSVNSGVRSEYQAAKKKSVYRTAFAVSRKISSKKLSFRNKDKNSNEKGEVARRRMSFLSRGSSDGSFSTPRQQFHGSMFKGLTLNLPKVTLLRNKSARSRRSVELRPSKTISFHNNQDWHNIICSELKWDKARAWVSEFVRSDPRWQIMTLFSDLAQAGADELDDSGTINMNNVSPLTRAFSRSRVFTVWRPTSNCAIRKMMMGEATGKGLNIKGKSAKDGLLSGFVPFLQIHSNESHKKKIGTLPKDARIRVFFRDEESRILAVGSLHSVMKEMMTKVQKARIIISDTEGNYSAEEEEEAYEHLLWDVQRPELTIIDDYAPKCFGIDLPERVFWEAFVMRKDIKREIGSGMHTGRPSEPAFQEMCFQATRKDEGYDPKAVVYQYGNPSNSDPLCPLSLLMAYEENGRVLPVASDFDGFMVGTKRVTYEKSMPPEQLELLSWCIDQIGKILDDPKSRLKSWTSNWLEVLKKSSSMPHIKMPQFGYGDRKSYAIIKNAVYRLKDNGAVRHGSECFNYYFPQNLDDEFLVISGDGNMPGEPPWKYMNVPQLQEHLLKRIDEGYTFPLNPKWILCDPGWKKIYDKLCSSQHPKVQQSLDAWYPPGSGIREKIESIHRRHPRGFMPSSMRSQSSFRNIGGTAAKDLAELELERYRALQRAKKKMRIILIWLNVAAIAKKEREQKRNNSLAGRRQLTNDLDKVEGASVELEDIPIQAKQASSETRDSPPHLQISAA